MNVPTVCSALVFAGLAAIIAPSTVAQTQSSDKGVSATKNTGAAEPHSATPNTNTNPTKHRYWRHQGGRHPHYGSRRVRT